MEHCIHLYVRGPIDIPNITKEIVEFCVEYGLNHRKTEHILEGIVAIIADIKASTKGAFTVAKLSDYIRSASRETVSCLKDEKTITEALRKNIEGAFDAKVVHEMEWVYWDS